MRISLVRPSDAENRAGEQTEYPRNRVWEEDQLFAFKKKKKTIREATLKCGQTKGQKSNCMESARLQPQFACHEECSIRYGRIRNIIPLSSVAQRRRLRSVGRGNGTEIKLPRCPGGVEKIKQCVKSAAMAEEEKKKKKERMWFDATTMKGFNPI